MDSETTELLLANRSFMYALVARMFAEEPDEALAEVLASDHARAEAGLVEAAETDSIVALFDGMAGLFARHNGVSDAAGEYVRVFVGPGTLRANPWETVQLTGTRALFQAGVLEVRDAYREAGFEPVRVREVPDDFIGIELDFLAKLAARAQAKFVSGDTTWLDDLGCSRRFLEKHLLKWVGKLAGSIEAEYGDGFYACACRLTELVAKRDLKTIEDLGVR